MLDTMIEAAMTEFKRKITKFGENHDLSDLTPDLAEHMGRFLQEALACAGQASYSAFLQSYDTEQDVVRDAHGEVFRFKGKRVRRFMTPFGVMTVNRSCYQNKSDTRSYVPLDAAWGMEDRYLTPQVREAMLFASALVTPQEAMKLFHKCALFHPHATLIKREVMETGALFEKHKEALARAVRAEESAPEGAKALVVSADGATVLMNEKGVHFGRPRGRPGGDASEEKPTAYRVAMVGTVSHYGAPREAGKGPQRLQSRYVGQMPEEGWPTFKALFGAEVDDAEARLAPEVARILLLDGSRQLWSYFDNDPRYDGYHRGIDFWHAVDHLSVAAEALFGSGKMATRWYDKYRLTLRDCADGAKRILHSIDYYATKYTRSKTSQKHLNEERTYFKRNARLMNYATFRANGWPIGSGPVEAACKTLIKTRLCRSGMRWTREGGQHILYLRVAVKSDRWEQTWKQIRVLEDAA